MNNVIARFRSSIRRFGLVRPRGANLVEYMILVGAVALVSLAAAKTFQGTVEKKMGEEGKAVSSIPVSGGGGGGN